MNNFLDSIIDKKIDNIIYYIPSEESPVLSAESFIINGKDNIWIYDVGASDYSLQIIEQILTYNQNAAPCNIVISHFHEDHAANLSRIKSKYNLYTSKYTYDRYKKYLGVNCLSVNFINEIKQFDDNQIFLFPIPAIHAKGCLGLGFGNYALTGDSIYCKYVDGHVTYNQQLLRDQKKIFSTLSADRFILSHEAPKVTNKAEIIGKINKLLTFAVKDSPYIVF